MAEAVEEKVHARKGPSGADTWAVCYGAPAMQDGEENKSSIYARWGTCAHEVAGIVLQSTVCTNPKGDGDAQWCPENAEAYVGRVFQIEGFDVEFDMEMAECVNDYIAHVESYWEPGDILLAEQAVPIDHITGEKGATGTSDCIIIKPSKREIIAIDLKGGKGVQVDAERNRQAAMYSDGAIVEHDLFYGPFDWVTSVIIQPRIFNVSEYRVSRAEHDAFIDEIKAAAAKSVEADEAFVADLLEGWAPEGTFASYLVPGEKQCRFCNAKAKCPALSGVVSNSLKATAPRADEFPDMSLPKQAANAVDPERIGGLPEVDLGKAMAATDLIEQWIKAIRAEVARRLFDGKEVKGYYLGVGKKGNRTWTDKDEVEAIMKAAKLKVDEMYSKTLITAPAAEKALKDKPRIWSKLAPLIGQSDGKPSVCKDGDKNEPFKIGVEPDDFPDLDAEPDPFS